MKKSAKQILFYVVLIVAVIMICAMLFRQSTVSMKYSDVVSAFKADENGQSQIEEFQIDKNNVLTMVFRDDSEIGKTFGVKNTNGKLVAEYRLASLNLFHADLGETIVKQIQDGTLKGEYVAPTQYSAWLSYLPIILIVVSLIIMYVIMTRSISAGGGKMNNFAKSRARMANPQDRDKVTFRDVAGADEEKEELEEIVEFLKNPARFAKLGAKIPHGVLLMGPPGTGKTLLAKAVAGEAGVPFYSISGSDFVEMYVGVGASRVRDLFDTARKSPASIVFIDEIDAVGRHRGAGLGGGHDEREQTLNQLLVEMDGFGSHDGIIVIAATNRPDILDPALLRPGRFDRQITVNYPDLKGREEILKVHSRKKPLELSVDLAEVARSTVGFTGADLANLLNEAALLAARRGKALIGKDDIDDAYLRIITGPQKKSRKMKEKELRNTAYHEAGHAIIAHKLPYMDPVQLISIIPSGSALGYTLNPPTEDKYSVYREEIKQKIAMLLGGRVAEQIVFGDFSGGASNDIQRATSAARKMVTELGMSDVVGPVHYGAEGGEVFLGRNLSSGAEKSEKMAAIIDEEVHNIINEAYERAKTILTENIDKLHFIADFLVKHETMDGDQFRALMDEDADEERLLAILEEKRQASIEANAKQAEKERLRREAFEKRVREIEIEEGLVSPDEAEPTTEVVPTNNDESGESNESGENTAE